LVVRLLFFKKVFKSISKVFSKVVKPVINVVKKHGQIIGAVAGGLIGATVGLVTAGPVGAATLGIHGAKLGGMIGLTAQTVAKACIPDNRVTIKCTGQNIASAVRDFAISAATSMVCAKTICPVV